MVSAVTGSDGQTFVSIVGESSPAVKVSLLTPVVVYNYPADYDYTSQAYTVAVAESQAQVYDSQSFVVVVYRGRLENYNVRTWTFNLDGHEFYCITLGETSTLVYDLTTEQWAEWSTPGYDVWRAHRGCNWVSLSTESYSSGANSTVVAGDNNYGRLWFVDPTIGYDEDVVTGENTPFARKVIAGVKGSMRQTQQVGAVYLTASMATPQLTGASITLRTSDDAGNNWTDHGTITVEPGNYDQEFSWRSLGAIRRPGRLFEITDDGASVRIDSLDMR